MSLETWEAILLGIVQGLTEWLPVSSSGHLVIMQEALGLEVPIFYDLWLHVATLAVVVFHYRRRLAAMAAAVATWPAQRRQAEEASPQVTEDRRLAVALVVGTVPIVVAGFLFRQHIEDAFDSLAIVGVSLLITTALLVSTVWARPRDRFGPGRALATGCFQALALLPGVSRSGATIAGAMHMGLSREKAADFAFLLLVPALTGAVVLLLPDALRGDMEVTWSAFLAGGLAAALVGYLTLRFLLAVVKRWGLLPFAPYTFAVGVILLLV